MQLTGSHNTAMMYCVSVNAHRWKEAIKRAMAMIGQEDLLSPEPPSSPVGNEFPGGRLPLGLSSLTSHLNPRGNGVHA